MARFAKGVVICAMVFGALILALPAEASLENIDRFIDEGLPFFASRVSPAKLRRIEGLIREEKRIVPNEHEPEKNDPHYFFYYSGLEVWLLYPPKERTKCLLSQVSLAKPGYRVKYGLGVGASASAVVKVLGEPAKRENNEWLH